MYFTSQMILKLTQSSGVSNKSTAMSVELCMSFFPTQTVWQDPDRRIPNANICFFTDILVLLTVAVSVPTLEVGMKQTKDVRSSNTNRQ